MFFPRLDTRSLGILSEELAPQMAEMCEGWHWEVPSSPPSCQLTISWLGGLGDRAGFPSLTFKVGPMWAASGDVQAGWRPEWLLGVAQARAMGLELGLRYTEGPAGAAGGVGSSSMKAE